MRENTRMTVTVREELFRFLSDCIFLLTVGGKIAFDGGRYQPAVYFIHRLKYLTKGD